MPPLRRLLMCFVLLALCACSEGDGIDFEKTKKRAEAKIAAAQYHLGIMYSNGTGVPEDDAEALKWFRKAAEQGHRNASVLLGGLYSIGGVYRKTT